MSSLTSHGKVCSHCASDTLLECIRCRRPYCQNCLTREDAGLICFECLGRLPPDQAARRQAWQSSLTLAGIATVANILFQVVTDSDLTSPWALVAGVAAGWFIGDQLRARAAHRRGRASWLGALAVFQGVVAGSFIAAIGRLSLDGGISVVASADLLAHFLALVISSVFFLAGGIAAVIWRLARP